MSEDSKIGLWEAVSIGIGGMVGGGIFAVLGLAVALAQGGTPVAFLFAGVITLLTAYSYAKMSLQFPSSGGTVHFVNQGFGKNVLSGGANNLLWVSYIVMLSLYASAFGSYAAELLPLTGGSKIDSHIYLSAIIIIATVINYFSVKIVGEIEDYAVGIKLIILGVFVVVGLIGLNNSGHLEQLTMSHWETPFNLLTGGMVIFVAYEGFELIANTSSNIYPKKNIARSYYISVGFVILLYILIAIITVGSLSFSEIDKAKDYALAEAARPMLGKVGFAVITVAAMISTFSAINATLYGGSRVNYKLAKADELPHEFTKKFWDEPIGLLITSVFTLLIANTLNLESISTSGSAGFLLVFGLVNLANFKLAKQTHSIGAISLIASILCFIALLTLLVQQFFANRLGTLVSVGIILVCYITEGIFKASEKRKAR